MRISPRILLFALALAAGALAGCGDMGTDITAPETGGRSSAGDPFKAAADVALINGHLVRFDGREYVDGQTTFSYTVLPSEEASPLQRFFVEVPEGLADPVAVAPAYGHLEGLAKYGLYGVIWRTERADNTDDPAPQPADSLFSVTYEGDVPLGTIQAMVGADLFYEAGTVYGPGLVPMGYTVSGTVFVDTDFDGVQDSGTEPGLPDIIVELVAPDASVDTVRTAADGSWFAENVVLPVTVRIDPAAYPEAGNAALDLYYEATTVLSQEVEGEGDAAGVDFGFAPLTDELADAVEMGELPSNGEDRKFWRSQFKRALVHVHRRHDRGNGPGQVFDEDELLAFIQVIQGLYYEDPFAFTPGRELREAYKLLLRKPRTKVQELRQELFVTELNHVARLGLWAENRQLQADLISWGESVVVQTEAEAAAKAGNTDKAGDQLLGKAIRVFKAINTGGGGIIDE